MKMCIFYETLVKEIQKIVSVGEENKEQRKTYSMLCVIEVLFVVFRKTNFVKSKKKEAIFEGLQFSFFKKTFHCLKEKDIFFLPTKRFESLCF